MSSENIIALTELSVFSRHTDLPQLPLNEITIDNIRAYDLALICPEIRGNPKPLEIIEWKRAGLLPRTKLCFGTFKGIFYWSRENENAVERWVVHCKSEIVRCQSSRMTFIPLPFQGLGSHMEIRGRGEGSYIFCGGRTQRDFEFAAAAVAKTPFKALFVSDLLPSINAPNIYCIPHRTFLDVYQVMMAMAWCTLVPVTPGLESHGHSDIVRSLVAGRPVIATKNASCDDYIIDGVNGYLVSFSVEDLTLALTKAFDRREELTIGAINSAHTYSPDAYNFSIHQMIQDVLEKTSIP